MTGGAAKDLVRPLITVLCLSALLAFVYQQSQAIDVERIKNAQRLLVLIESQQHLIERDMLRIRNGDLVHFDSLKYAHRKMLKVNDSLLHILPVSVRDGSVELRKSIKAQNLAIEHFMSDQSILTNSLRFLPKAIAMAVQKAPTSTSQFYALHRDVLRYLRGANPAEADKIQQQLSSLSGSKYVQRHVGHILMRTQNVEKAIIGFHNADVVQKSQQISTALEVYLAAGVASMHRHQIWLIVLALVLIVYIGWVVWRQTRVAHDLRNALGLVDAQQSALDEYAIVTIADQKGDITYANDKFCEISGYSREEVIGKNHRILNSGLHEKSFFKEMWGTIIGGQTWHGVIQNRCKDGSYYWVNTSIVPFLDEDGKPYQYVSIRTDITRAVEHEEEERLHQKKLEHAQRLESLGVLAGGIAHDFNNLLTSIMGNAGLVDRTIKASDPTKDKVQRIIDASEKAASLCKQMLAYSGKGHFIVQACDMSLLAEEMMELLQISIDKNVIIKYELAANLPTINADVAQMHQVIMNLITNANEAIDGNSGVITLSTGWLHADQAYLKGVNSEENLPAGDYVYLEVSDNGCGMDKKMIDKIFDPFFTTKFTGRGLGLSAMLGIVRGHKGAVKVYSELRRGTTFKILFPIADPNSTITSTDETAIAASMHVESGTALVVDDEEMIREMASVMLSEMGFDILTAANGLEAVKLYPEHMDKIKLVLLDMSMPKMDGEETFRELRRMNPDVCVVLSSGYNEQEATERFKGKGLSGFVQKPYLPDALEKVVSKALS